MYWFTPRPLLVPSSFACSQTGDGNPDKDRRISCSMMDRSLEGLDVLRRSYEVLTVSAIASYNKTGR